MMINKEKNFVSAVVYVYNAEKEIEFFLKSIISVLEDNFEHSEIICVNDFSVDNSVAVIKSVSNTAKTTSISLLNMSYMHGSEVAMNAGVDLAIGDFVLEFDNTVLDFDGNEVVKVYKRALQGFDVVSASSDKKARATSNFFYKIFGHFVHLPSVITTESFRILSRRLINRTRSTNKTVTYRKVAYANSGLSSDNIKYKAVDNKNNKHRSSQEKKYMRRLAIDSFIIFTDLGFKFSVSMTLIMMSISLLMAIYSLLTYMFKYPVKGWTTTVLFVSGSFFGLFAILTIIVKYLQLIINMIFKRKHYSVENIEKLTN